MYINVLDYIDEIADRFPQKTAYQDLKTGYSFFELRRLAKRVGSSIIKRIDIRGPVVVYMEKNASNMIAFFGAAYAGCFYVPIDSKMPIDRIRLIIKTLNPLAIIYDNATKDSVKDIKGDILSLDFNEIIKETIDDLLLAKKRGEIKSSDLLYVLFTSGSTGVPKGVSISHFAIIDKIEWICKKYGLDENVSLCNQAPFYFDLSIPDIYVPIRVGATCFIPPKSYYTFPKKILEYIETNDINTLVWIPSALSNVVNLRAFEVVVPKSIKLVIFCGDVMPCKHLNVWKKYVPGALYVNMYGPTEATFACTYYDVTEDFKDDESLPIGVACDNSEVLIITEDGKLAKENEEGEICILGHCLANGYYNNWEKTKEVFIQNPLNTNWIELMYRTGDIGRVNKKEQIEYCGRVDNQIKRLGHRIELGEIENAALSIDEVNDACCVFDKEKSEICLAYVGAVDEVVINDRLKTKISQYLMPNLIVKLDRMPLNSNGKTDRIIVKSMVYGG